MESGSSSSKTWTIAFIVTVSVARIGMGIFTSLSGPTLLYLADNVDVSVSKVSAVFSGRSLGILLGSILGGVMKNITGPSFRHLFTLGKPVTRFIIPRKMMQHALGYIPIASSGLGIGVLGLMDFAVPWIGEFWVLILDITIGGIMFGYLDAGLQALILQLWGEEASRSQIQVFHLMYSVGALAAPLLASPFLEKADEEVSADESCPNVDPVDSTTTMPNFTTTVDPFASSFNPIGWSYVIAASWMVFVALILVLLASLNVEARVSNAVQRKGYSSEERLEEPLGDVIWVFLPVIGYYFCSVTTENVFYTYIYSVALCTDLDFTVSQASQITSVFWLGFGIGRLCGVVASMYFKPKTIIIASIIGSITDSLFMCIFGEQTVWLAWLVSGLHGVTTALLYPSGVSWVSQITNISGTYMFICNIGNAVGSLTMLPLAGYLFDLDPFSVMYLVFGLASLNAVFFSLVYLAGRNHTNFLWEREDEKSRVFERYTSIDLTCKADQMSIEEKESYLTSTKL